MKQIDYKNFFTFLIFLIMIITLFNSVLAFNNTYYCNSCASCNNAINQSQSGDIIYLNTTINTNSSCLLFSNKENVTFDCDNNYLFGLSSTPYAFNMNYSQDITIQNCNIQNFSIGIFVGDYSNRTFINNNYFENCEKAIELSLGLYTSIKDNTFFDNGNAIYDLYSHFTSITNNDLSYNDYGLYLVNTFYLSILSNDISRSYHDGIFLSACLNSNITNNLIRYNLQNGIYLLGDNNILSNNNIIDNDIGLRIYNSENNTLVNSTFDGNDITLLFDSSNYFNHIYNNKFISPYNDIRIILNTTQQYWNTTLLNGENIIGGNYIGGNYYATAYGTGYSDLCEDAEYPFGICDEPYQLDANNIDYYPLREYGFVAEYSADDLAPAIVSSLAKFIISFVSFVGIIALIFIFNYIKSSFNK